MILLIIFVIAFIAFSIGWMLGSAYVFSLYITSDSITDDELDGFANNDKRFSVKLLIGLIKYYRK